VRAFLEEGLPLVQGDPNQLRQIIHNLIRNAQDATEGRADLQIDVRTRLHKRRVELCIADNGPGFPPEIIANAFEPYVTTKPKGTGLGLAIVKKMIEDHGGKISLSNQQSGGAEICIQLQITEITEQVNHHDTEQ
jgi:nitrogen fixation/metabolism regulation signal transduction histidine kinase